MAADSWPDLLYVRRLAVVFAVVSRFWRQRQTRRLTVVASCILGSFASFLSLADGVRGPLAPDFALPALANPPERTANQLPLIHLSDFRGRVVYLSFWDSSCAPCRTSLPLLSELRDSYSRDDFEVLAVNLDPNPADAMRFLARANVTYPVTSDVLAGVAATYGVTGVPTAFYLSRDGQLQGQHQGFKHNDLNDIRLNLTELIGQPNGYPEGQ